MIKEKKNKIKHKDKQFIYNGSHVEFDRLGMIARLIILNW